MEEMFRRRLEQNYALVWKSSLSNQNKELISRFAQDCVAQGIGAPRVAKYLFELRKLGEWLKKDLDAATREDLTKLLAELEMSAYAELSKYGFKIALKKFYKWLNGGESYPEVIKWLHPRIKKNRILLPEELLSEEDVKKLIDAADHPRDRAFVATLYETGARIGDLLYTKLKSIEFDQYGALLTLKGKTGMRRVRAISSVPYLMDWINHHPRKDDPEAFLWTTRDYRFGEITYNRIRLLLLNLRKRARIKKKVNPHNFRHSRATYLANHLTESQMKEYLGWVQSSKMAAVYVHLSGRDVDSALLKLHGLEPNEVGQANNGFQLKSCSRCREKNSPTTKFCAKCGLVIDEDTRMKIVHSELERKNADTLLDDMLSDEAFRLLFVKRARQVLMSRGSARGLEGTESRPNY